MQSINREVRIREVARELGFEARWPEQNSLLAFRSA